MFQIPVPISSIKAQHKSMKWLIEAAKEKEDEERFYDTLAKELVSASQNQVYKFYQLRILICFYIIYKIYATTTRFVLGSGRKFEGRITQKMPGQSSLCAL